MTANRPRKTGPLEDEVLVQKVSTGWLVNRHSHLWRPPTDVYETEDRIIVQVEIAGVRQADFSVSLADRHLSISGVRHDPVLDRRAYHQMEIHFGEFRTDVDLPGPVDDQNIDAEYGDGFLRVILPRLKPQRLDPK